MIKAQFEGEAFVGSVIPPVVHDYTGQTGRAGDGTEEDAASPRRWTRRGSIGALAALAGAMLAACKTRPAGMAFVAPRRRMVDAHCHVFNVTDLPAATFIQQCMLGVEPGSSLPKKILLKSLQRIEALVSRGVISAKGEAEGAGAFVQDSPSLGRQNESELRKEQLQAEQALRELGASGALATCPTGPAPQPSIGSIVEWLRSFRSRRATLARTLAKAHAAGGYDAALLCPALVDYSNWLGQSLRSSLVDQANAMGQVASDPSLPPVHGYVAFDPLRRALYRNRLPVIDGSWDPLNLAKDALTRQGFVGIKLYPPMGFRASGNGTSGEDFPEHVRTVFGSAQKAGAEIDRSLDELWSLCLELDAPVLAHAAASNGSRRGYGRRADPDYWFPVIRRHPALRVLLGHFGRFRDRSSGEGPAACPNDEMPFEKTWEAAFGRFVQANPDALLFADLSYLSDLFHEDYRRRAVQGLKKYLAYDPEARHLVFGSDWVMLGIERAYPEPPSYPGRVAALLADAGLTSGQIDGVFYGNAVRFLGISDGTATRKRLLAFYAMRGMPPKNIPA